VYLVLKKYLNHRKNYSESPVHVYRFVRSKNLFELGLEVINCHFNKVRRLRSLSGADLFKRVMANDLVQAAGIGEPGLTCTAPAGTGTRRSTAAATGSDDW
jgi:hypothetical protein